MHATLDWQEPDYEPVHRERLQRLKEFRRLSPEDQRRLHAFYKTHPVEWIEDWAVTSDPREIFQGRSPLRPFILFPRQKELIEFFYAQLKGAKTGIVEKSRDTGISWCAMAFAVWVWLYYPKANIGVGSYEMEKVDALGVQDSLLEKARIIINALPVDFLHHDIAARPDKHLLYKRLKNPANQASIIGQAGDNCGRGARFTFYFVDEAAFLNHPAKIDSNLANTTYSLIYASTAHGLGMFYQKTQNKNFRQFRFHWRDDPRKTQAWYDEYLNTWGPAQTASEVDIDHHVSMENLVVELKWIEASQQVYDLLREKDLIPTRPDKGVSGLDVGGGRAPSVFVGRNGPYVCMPEGWTTDHGDTTLTAKKALRMAREKRMSRLFFDAPGVGSGGVEGVWSGLASPSDSR